MWEHLPEGETRDNSVCPTIAFRDGVPRCVVGAPGGTQIAMGVTQALINVMDFNVSAVEAVSAPRFSATSNVIDITNRIPNYVVEPRVDAGYRIERSAKSFGIAAVHGIRMDETGLSGGADPGHDGGALGV